MCSSDLMCHFPSPPAAAPAPIAIGSSPQESPWKMAHGPSALTAPVPASTRKSVIAKSVIWIAGAGLLVFIVLGVCLVMLRCIKRRPEKKNAKKLDDVGVFAGPLNKPTCSDSDVETANQEEKGKCEVPNRSTNFIPKVQEEQDIYVKVVSATSEGNNGHESINTGGASKLSSLQPPPQHFLPTSPGEKVIINPAITTQVTKRQVMSNSIRVYTVALLQQYTNSFSQENCIGEGTLGPVYRAELPGGKVTLFQLVCFYLYIKDSCSYIIIC